MTKQNKKYFDQLLRFLRVFLEESLCLLKAEIKVTVSSQIGRKIAENYTDSFYFIQDNGQTRRRNKGEMEVALEDKWLENLHI